MARISHAIAAGTHQGAIAQHIIETQAHLLGACPSFLAYYRRRHNDGLDIRVKGLEKLDSGDHITIQVDRSFNTIDPFSPSFDAGNLRPDIIYINENTHQVVLEEHTYCNDSTLKARVALKFAKYRPAVEAFKAAHPQFADYDFVISVFAVGHAGTVPECTIAAILNIPMPPDAAAVLVRTVVAAVSRNNANIIRARFRNNF
jgi:hypothetical protein